MKKLLTIIVFTLITGSLNTLTAGEDWELVGFLSDRHDTGGLLVPSEPDLGDMNGEPLNPDSDDFNNESPTPSSNDSPKSWWEKVMDFFKGW